jgi:hypothetical protein
MSDERAYLQKLREALKHFADDVRELELDHEDRTDEIVALVDEACEFEKTCREKHEMGARFNVVANQLRLLQARCKDHHEVNKAEKIKAADDIALVEKPVADDETLVFVYLFNINGAKLRNWEPMLTDAALSEHSVNRPIYASLMEAQDIIRPRPNPTAHAIIEVIVSNELVLETAKTSTRKDSLDHVMLRLRQSALKQMNVKAFYHAGETYCLAANGSLTPAK